MPERWDASWDNNLALAQMADDAGIEFLLTRLAAAKQAEPGRVELALQRDEEGDRLVVEHFLVTRPPGAPKLDSRNRDMRLGCSHLSWSPLIRGVPLLSPLWHRPGHN